MKDNKRNRIAGPETAPPGDRRKPHALVSRGADFRRIAAFVLLVVVLIFFGSPVASLVAGIVFSLVLGHPHARLGHGFTKWIFQGCVVLLGFGMDLEKVIRAGISGALFAAITITATLAAGFWLGRRLGIGAKTSALIASGTAICGGSAIAAVGPVIAATEAEMGIAVGSIFLLNAAALVVFPYVGYALHLTQHQFGVWAGIGIHDISSVVGASSVYGREALQTATAVKLSRALWIVPLTVGMSVFLARRHAPASPGQGACPEGRARRRPKGVMPWFIGFFGLASLLRSVLPAVARISPQIDHVAKGGMIVALCLIGAGISPAVLRKLGWKVALQAVLLWCFISVAALLIALGFA
jgi:uncharacterized integral membrane protein (TIGR00698 family)